MRNKGWMEGGALPDLENLGGWRCKWCFQDLDRCCEHDDGGEGDYDHYGHHFHDHNQGISSLPN